ncbi:synaptotagmin-7 isoform X1 [Arapaima gigas]
MVVLSLAIGLAEQDDFANIPDLQEAPATHNTPPDKRYQSANVRVKVRAEQELEEEVKEKERRAGSPHPGLVELVVVA